MSKTKELFMDILEGLEGQYGMDSHDAGITVLSYENVNDLLKDYPLLEISNAKLL